jgi:UPF0755 protein
MAGYRPSLLKESGILILIFLVTFSIFYVSRDLRINKSNAFVSNTDLVLFLEERKNLDELIEYLSDFDLEFDQQELRWVSSLLGWRNFSAGRYEVSGNNSYRDFLSKLALGHQDHAAVTIHPGMNIGRLSASLGRQLRADSSEFAAVFADSSDLILELGYYPESLFSRMLPDTYNLYWTSSPERVIRRIYDEFNRRVVNRFESEIAENSMDLEDLLIMASIIEWEARHRHEKPRISGLYWNRLNRNMRLQADPTVLYAVGEHRRLLFEDYQLDHPYNTYVIDGLPPGPITNPDILSIEAAITPEEHDYLFMVANPDGGHVFTRTFEEHRLASAEWRRWIREQHRIRDELERIQEASDSDSN